MVLSNKQEVVQDGWAISAAMPRHYSAVYTTVTHRLDAHHSETHTKTVSNEIKLKIILFCFVFVYGNNLSHMGF